MSHDDDTHTRLLPCTRAVGPTPTISDTHVWKVGDFYLDTCTVWTVPLHSLHHSRVAQNANTQTVEPPAIHWKDRRSNRLPRTTEEQQTYAIRLPDGEMVEWTAQELAHYDGDWHVNLTIEQSEKLYHAIMEEA